ncbi:MAG TPA: DUF1559 domain-containing protein [Methylomirabilota bacterium]|nr:DUF1559 domain-containing protein [Methylomirabilota bacterium]
MIALLLPAIQAAREAARREQVEANLQQIGLGLMDFEQDPDTSVGSVWLVDLLPYIEPYDSGRTRGFGFVEMARDSDALLKDGYEYRFMRNPSGEVIGILADPVCPGRTGMLRFVASRDGELLSATLHPEAEAGHEQMWREVREAGEELVAELAAQVRGNPRLPSLLGIFDDGSDEVAGYRPQFYIRTTDVLVRSGLAGDLFNMFDDDGLIFIFADGSIIERTTPTKSHTQISGERGASGHQSPDHEDAAAGGPVAGRMGDGHWRTAANTVRARR